MGPTDERRRCRLLPTGPDLLPQRAHQPRRAAIPRLVVAHSGRSLHRRTVDRHAAVRRAPDDPDGFTNRPANRCRDAPVGHGDEDFTGGDAGAHKEPGISQTDGRPHSTFGVVLVRDRCAEQRDDITLGGGFDRRPEPFQLYVQALVRPGCRCAEVLGIAIACDAGEFCGQDRNDLALLALRPTGRLQLPVGRRLARRSLGRGPPSCGRIGSRASRQKLLVHRSDRRARRATRTPAGLGRARAWHRRHRARYPPGESPPRRTPSRSSHPRAARARLPACPPARPDRAPDAASRATRRARPPDSQADPRATTCRSVRRGSRLGFDCTRGRRTRAGPGGPATQS